MSKSQIRKKENDGRPVTGAVIARLRRSELSKGKRSSGNLLLWNMGNGKRILFVAQMSQILRFFLMIL